MTSTSNERQLQLALQTFEQDPQLSISKAARLYNILRTILSDRINRYSMHVDIIPNLRKLTALEEEVVVREVFDLDSRRFPPRIRNMEDMANRLLTIRDATRVGSYWASNFVKR